MAKLVILDFVNIRVLNVDVCKEQVEKLDNEYNSNTCDWLCEEGLDEKLEINANCIQYMWLDDSETIQNITI